jgi:hypothetical protein
VAEKSDLPPYPLKEVLNIKNRRVEDAERVVKDKIKLLEQEKEKLKKREEERDQVLKHYRDKIKQMNEAFDEGTTSNKIEQMKIYIKVVQERLKAEEKKVKEQKQQVEVAEKNVELAKAQLKAREKERDKIITHRGEWEKETLRELAITEIREEDEVGSTMFLSKFAKKRAQKRAEEKE